MSFLAEKCTFKLLSQELLSVSDPFVCGDTDLNDFFANDCAKYSKNLLGKTYCFTLDDNPRKIVCAFTISNDSIKTNLLSGSSRNRLNREIPNEKRRLKSYPAVLIGRLGVSVEFEGKGVGKDLLNFIKSWFIDPENKTGCRFIVVDSYNKEKPLNYYVKNGFKFLFSNEQEEKEYSGILSDEPLHSRLMYFDLILLTGA